MITWICDCGASGRAKPKLAGRRVRCPKCQGPVNIPELDLSPEDDFDTWVEGRFDAEPNEIADDLALPGSRKPARPGRRHRKSKAAGSGIVDTSQLTKLERRLIWVGASVGSLFLIGIFTWIAMTVDWQKVTLTRQMPEKYVPYEFTDGEFACVYPEGWEASSGASSTVPPFAKFKDGDVRIEIRTAVTGSIMQMGANPFGSGGGVGEVSALHRLRRSQLEAGTDEYSEGETEIVMTEGMGEAMIASYSMTVLLDTDHGYRGTVCGPIRQYNVMLYCPKRLVDKYKPVFLKVLTSMEPAYEED